ncbi:MAG: radical SAM protein [Thermodesulfobacteriota bacterium]
MKKSWKLSEPRVKLAEVVPLSTPYLVIIDVANICNFKCNFCFQSVDKSRLRDMGFKPNIMDIEIFKKTINEVKKFPEQIKRIYLFAHGESLLNKNLPDMIAYAKEQNVSEVIQITTNGSLLNPDFNMKLINAGLDELRISIEGLSAEKYKKVADVDIDFESFIENIKHFYKNRGTCMLYVKAINVALDEGEEEQFYRLFNDISDNASIEYVTPYYEGVKYNSLFQQHDKTILGNQAGSISICPRIFYMLNICPDGNITMCNVDNLEQYVFGNVNTHSLVELWNGKEFTELRMQHLNNNGSAHPLCGKCACLNNCTQESDVLDGHRHEIIQRMLVNEGV